jgi:hypothetical protein
VSAEPIHEDVLVVLNVTGGVTPGGASWADSYSVGDQCYCRTTFDHSIGSFFVETPFGWLTTRQVCELLGEGPGPDGRPVYNDLQCGNGPPNDAGDEHVCPGRTDIGPEGCGHIGPTWNFDNVSSASVVLPFLPTDAHPDTVAVINVTGGVVPSLEMAESYSVDGRCYCMPTLNNGIGTYYVDSFYGWMTVAEICDLLGQGPEEGRVYYNDVQCGNGPPSVAGDEHSCPGRVDMGSQAGCGYIGPKWKFDILDLNETIVPSASNFSYFPSDMPSTTPSEMPTSLPTTNRTTTVPSAFPSDLPSAAPTEAQPSPGIGVIVPSGSGNVTISTPRPTFVPVATFAPMAAEQTSSAGVRTGLSLLLLASVLISLSNHGFLANH